MGKVATLSMMVSVVRTLTVALGFIVVLLGALTVATVVPMVTARLVASMTSAVPMVWVTTVVPMTVSTVLTVIEAVGMSTLVSTTIVSKLVSQNQLSFYQRAVLSWTWIVKAGWPKVVTTLPAIQSAGPHHDLCVKFRPQMTGAFWDESLRQAVQR